MKPVRVSRESSLVLLCIATNATAQTTLREWNGPVAGDTLGAGLATLRDVDGDGIHDFAIGVPGDDTLGTNRGVVRVVSGADGHEIRRYYGAATEPGFGGSVTRLGDVDLDGVVDVLVGSKSQGSPLNVPTQFTAVSGASGNLLWSSAISGSSGYGVAIATLGDVNLDGVPDVGIGDPNDGPGYAGRLRVLSGLDGSVLYDIIGSGTYVGTVYGLAPAGDLDADGHADWWMSYASLFQSSHAQARSGIDGHVLADITVPLVYSEFTGVRFVGGNDLDGDGVLDLVVGSHASPGKGGNGPGHVYAYSGNTHALLWSQAGANFGDRIGLFVYDVGDLDGDGVSDVGTSVGHETSAFMKTARFYSGASGAPIGGNASIPSGTILLNVAPAGDVDGDGHGDWIGSVFATSIFGSAPLPTAIGTVQVRTFAREALVGDRFTLRHAAGGVQTLTLDFGSSFAGREFRVLGSLTGTDPGIPTVAGEIPLTPDVYFSSTRRPGGNGHLTRASGTLDTAGRATATFTLAPGSERFPIGTVLEHAAVVLDAGGTQPAAVSRAVPLVVSVDG